MYAKYLLLKELYPKHVILINKKNSLVSYNDDEIIYKYNKTKNYNYVILKDGKLTIENKYTKNYNELKNKYLLLNFFIGYRKKRIKKCKKANKKNEEKKNKNIISTINCEYFDINELNITKK